VDHAVIRIVNGKIDEKVVLELIARFPTLEEARRVAQSAHQNDILNRDEYMVTSDPENLALAAASADSRGCDDWPTILLDRKGVL